MKYFFVVTLLFIIGCSHTTGTNTTQNLPFSPGGQYYVAPGRFVGTLSIDNFPQNGPNVIDSTTCILVVTEADSLLFGTITNNSTNEIDTIKGFHALPHENSFPWTEPLHFYYVKSITPLADTTEPISLSFLVDGDTLETSYKLKKPNQNFIATVIQIFGIRK
jgi:hypothetical protein